MVVQFLAGQVAQDITDGPARAPGRAFPAGLVEPGEEMVKPRRFHIKYAERVQPGQCRRVHDMPSAGPRSRPSQASQSLRVAQPGNLPGWERRREEVISELPGAVFDGRPHEWPMQLPATVFNSMLLYNYAA